MVVLEGGHFVLPGTMFEPFLSAPPIAIPFSLVGEERNEDPVGPAPEQDFNFLHCPIGYGRGGDVALGWTCICLGREGLWELSLALVMGLMG